MKGQAQLGLQIVFEQKAVVILSEVVYFDPASP
jgi:hypothetical protein